MTAPVRTFLPWYRVGFATALAGAPPAGAARAAVPVGVRLRGEPGRGRLAVPLALTGPGDVVGLDRREVQRTEPFDGCPDFEPSSFPYVELASPDLPWRFSPEGPASSPLPAPADDGGGSGPGGGVQQRVRPWLALVVVPVERSTLTAAPASSGSTAVLGCEAAQLPDPTEAWAWAHVQVTHDPAQPLAEALATPGAARARLLCPRLLDPGVRYRAALVPTYAAGRSALLGAPGPDPLGPAWGPTGDVALPTYLTWTFGTGPEGSFEALVRRLRPRPVPAAGGGRTLVTGAPRWGAHAATDDATVVMQGALRPVGVAEPPADDPVLAESLRVAVSRTGAELELRPPLYGQDHRRGLAALPPGTEGWLTELNTDPRRRVAAGLAAWAVAVHQEDLVDAAWQQLAADQGAGGRRQVDPTLAGAVTGSLSDRHGPSAVTGGGATTGTPGLVGNPDAAGVAGALARQLRAGGPLSASAPRADLAAVVGTAVPSATAGSVGPTVSLAAADATAATAATEPGDGFAPHYDQPAYELLRSLAPEWLLPAVGELPVDSVALAQTNGAFIESYLLGLNHSLARELVWRRFPLRTDGTFFDRFWAATGDAPGAVLPPVATWADADRLGSHTTAEDQLVLVIRGALLQRFPTAAVYLARPGPGAAGAEQQLLAAFSGRIGADCAFLGFPLTADAARTGGWSIVVQEALGHARFGVDDPPAGGGTTPLASWQDLDRHHPQLTGRAHVPVAGALAGVRRPLAQGSAASAVWGLDAAQQAVIVQQPAFRVRIPVALWLGPAAPATP
jgi:hypothetical protein